MTRKSSSHFIATALFLSLSIQAHAGKGGFVRIFNLTPHPITCTAENPPLFGFKYADAAVKQLSGTIAPGKALPSNGAAYIEETNLIYSDTFFLKFEDGNGRANAEIFYNGEFGFKTSREDFPYSITAAIQPGEKAGTQYMVTILVRDRYFDGTNWMGQIDGSTDLGELLIPGTSNSAAVKSNGSPNEYVDLHPPIRKQLDDGFRYLDLRGGAPTGRDIRAYKGNVPLRLMWSDVFREISVFLRANPRETVLLQTSMNVDSGPLADESLQFLVERYRPFFYDDGFGTDNQLRLPKLERARGKIVLINNFSNALNGRIFAFDLSGAYPANGEDNSTAFAIQNRITGLDLSQKKSLANRFLKGAMRDRSNKLTVNNLAATDNPNRGRDDQKPGWSPWKFALGTSGDNAEGMNLFFAKELSFISDAREVDGVVLMECPLPNDPIARIAANFSYAQHRLVSDQVQAGKTYRFFTALAPDLVLTGTPPANGQARKTVVQALNGAHEPPNPFQAFSAEAVRSGRDTVRFRLQATGNTPTPLVLTDKAGENSWDGVALTRLNADSSTDQIWSVNRYHYTTIVSPATARVVEVRGDPVRNGSSVRTNYSNLSYLPRGYWIAEMLTPREIRELESETAREKLLRKRFRFLDKQEEIARSQLKNRRDDR